MLSPLGLSNVVQVIAAPQRACAVRDDGSLWCWGRNDHGQLGTGDRQQRFVPTPISL